MKCEITEIDPPRKLAFTWGRSGGVSFELEPRGERVLLTLVHRRLPDQESLLNVSGGWHAHLDVLEARLEDREPAPFWDEWTCARRNTRPAFLLEEIAAAERRSLSAAVVALEYRLDVARHELLAAKAAIVLGRRKPQVSTRQLHRHRQVLEPVLHIGVRVEQLRTIAAETDAARRGALQLIDAIFAGRAARSRIVVGFDLGDAERKPGRHAIGRSRSLDDRDDIVTCSLGSAAEAWTLRGLPCRA